MLSAVMDRLANKEIEVRFSVPEASVKGTIQQLFRKFEVKDQIAAGQKNNRNSSPFTGCFQRQDRWSFSPAFVFVF